MFVDSTGFYLYQQNKSYPVNGIEMGNIPWGKSNIADNGCGPIAMYNILYSVEPNSSFNATMDILIALDGIPKNGGTKWQALIDAMNLYFYKVYTYDSNTAHWGAGVKGKVDGIIVRIEKNDIGHAFAGVSVYFDDTTWHNYFEFFNSGISGLTLVYADIPRMLREIQKVGAIATHLIIVKQYRYYGY